MEDLKEGSGPECKPGNKVGMFYEGRRPVMTFRLRLWIMDYGLFSSLQGGSSPTIRNSTHVGQKTESLSPSSLAKEKLSRAGMWELLA